MVTTYKLDSIFADLIPAPVNLTVTSTTPDGFILSFDAGNNDWFDEIDLYQVSH